MAKYDIRLDLIFAALADPTRREILMRLARGPATVSELAAPHDMALPSFLKHLGRLETAGVVRSVKTGRVRTCVLSPDAFLPVQDWLGGQRAIWTARLDQLDDYVTGLAKAGQEASDEKASFRKPSHDTASLRKDSEDGSGPEN